MAMRRLGRSVQITGLMVAMIAGVFVGRSEFEINGWWIVWWGAVCAIALLKRWKVSFICVVWLVVLFGVWRGYGTLFSHSLLGQNIGNQVSLVGTISDDPGINEYGQLEFGLGQVQLNGQSVTHAVKVRAAGYQSLRRGYRVIVTGKLAETLGIAPVRISFAQVHVLSMDVGWLEELRGRFFATVRDAVPEPMSGFGIGLLLGARSLMEPSLQDALSVVGLTHLVAVSGYNLTIMAQAAQKLFLRISIFIATAVTIWFLFSFILMAGFSASIVRASLVAMIGLLISYYGFQAKPMTLLALPAMLTIAWNPDYLLRDLGWQLSFLAFYGVLVVAPLIEQRWVKQPNMIKSLFIESTAAHVMTLPLIMWRFQTVSVIAPASNIVVLPLVPMAMLTTFLTGIVGMVHPAAGAIIGLPTAGLLGLMIGSAKWFAAWPMASTVMAANGLLVIGFYGLIVGLVVLMRRGVKSSGVRESRLGGTILAGSNKTS